MNFAKRLADKGFLQERAEDRIDWVNFFDNFYFFFIKEFSYISYEEFLRIPIPLFLTMFNRLRSRLEKPQPQPVVVMGFAKKGFAKR